MGVRRERERMLAFLQSESDHIFIILFFLYYTLASGRKLIFRKKKNQNEFLCLPEALSLSSLSLRQHTQRLFFVSLPLCALR
jgi:hypothetical protein